VTNWNERQNFTPLVRLGEILVRLTKISLYERLKGIEPELKKAGIDTNIKELFHGDVTKDLRQQLQVPETRPKSFLAVVDTLGSKF
jgi:hypothetical protein